MSETTFRKLYNLGLEDGAASVPPRQYDVEEYNYAYYCGYRAAMDANDDGMPFTVH